MKKYPTKEDIEKHTKQLLQDLRTHILGYDKKADFVSNGLRCIFVDLVLEADNLNLDIKNAHYETFIKRLSKTKTGFPIKEQKNARRKRLK
ncbi:hypothetical protein LCGC14_2498820 [marine sediment metagenome]|uniref:Uncharacterized protein n=1 Tax=marine sediment metagenome TaxID=412755 RepID=A0A0F9DEB5_9ZZZZ